MDATEKPPDPGNSAPLATNQGRKSLTATCEETTRQLAPVKRWFRHADWLRSRRAFRAWAEHLIATRITLRRFELRGATV
jgi:hypothetical protein